MKDSTKQNKWLWKDKHHADILRTMKKILENEPYNKTLSDEKLAKAIMEQGVFCSACIVRDIRLANDIPNCDQRKVSQFAKQHKAAK